MLRRLSPEGKRSDLIIEPTEDTDNANTKEILPFSTFLMGRIQEKEELQHLNDRFAHYIQVLHDDLFGEEIKITLEASAKAVRDKLESLSQAYEDNINLLRKNLDETSLELASTKIKLETVTTDKDKVVEELKVAKTRETSLSSQLLSLTTQLSQIKTELNECINVKQDYDILCKQCQLLREQLESETLLRTDLKNRLLTAYEQLELKNRLLNQERDLLNNETLQTQLSNSLQHSRDYRVKLTEKLDEVRTEMTTYLKNVLASLVKKMELSLDAERSRTNAARTDLEKQTKDCARLSNLVVIHKNELHKCHSNLNDAYKRISDLESTLERIKDEFLWTSKNYRRKVKHLLNLLVAKSSECAELFGVKIQLDTEIALYRKLLESEEARCNLSGSSSNLTAKPIISRTLKRKHPFSIFSPSGQHYVDLDSTVLSASFESFVPPVVHYKDYGFTMDCALFTSESNKLHLKTSPMSNYCKWTNSLRITCSADGPVHFASADPGDGLLRVYNASNEPTNLGLWRLYTGPTSAGKSDYVKLYTFPESQILQPHSELQMYLSYKSESDQALAPKQLRRHVSPIVHLITSVPVWNRFSSVIVLQDSNGFIRAICEMEPCTNDTSLDRNSNGIPQKTNNPSIDGDNIASSHETTTALTIIPTLTNFTDFLGTYSTNHRVKRYPCAVM